MSASAIDPLILVFGAAAGTYLWRFLGVAISGRLDSDSAWFRWIACVAYAMLAGLIARMVVLPVGPLEATSLFERLAGVAVAIAIYFLGRRNLMVSVFAGVSAMVILSVGMQYLD
ncbi:MAG: AzlD domain-containing protein [Pseudomonadota bacterium]